MRNLSAGELEIIELTMSGSLILSPAKVELETWGSVYVRALFTMGHAEIMNSLKERSWTATSYHHYPTSIHK